MFEIPQGCRVGVLVCYGNNLIENPRINAPMGAEVLFAPHQTGGVRSKSPSAMGPVDPVLWKRREKDPAAMAQDEKTRTVRSARHSHGHGTGRAVRTVGWMKKLLYHLKLERRVT